MAKEGKATVKKTDDSLGDVVILSAAIESEHYEIAAMRRSSRMPRREALRCRRPATSEPGTGAARSGRGSRHDDDARPAGHRRRRQRPIGRSQGVRASERTPSDVVQFLSGDAVHAVAVSACVDRSVGFTRLRTGASTRPSRCNTRRPLRSPARGTPRENRTSAATGSGAAARRRSRLRNRAGRRR